MRSVYFGAIAFTVVAVVGVVFVRAQSQSPAWPAIAGLPLDFQVSDLSLPVSGEIPTFLTGTVFRNGPANWTGITELHWFNGFALLHAFSFGGDGSVTYTSQYVRSTEYNDTTKSKSTANSNKLVGVDPCKQLFGNAQQSYSPSSSSPDPFSPNTLVTIKKIMNHQTGKSHYLTNTALIESNEFDPVTLDTVAAPFQYNDGITAPVASLVPEHSETAPDGTIYHWYNLMGEVAHVNEQDGTAINLDPAAGYYVYSIPAGSVTRNQLSNGVPVPVGPFGVPAYQHSFGLSTNYLIMSETPCTFGRSGFSSYQFFKALPVNWRVVSLKTGLQTYSFVTNPPFFMMHHINAFEDSVANTITVDLIGYSDASILDSTYLDQLRYNASYFVSTTAGSRIMRFVLPLNTPGVNVAPIIMSSVGFELPTMNRAYKQKPYRYVYATGFVDPKTSTFMDCVQKTDLLNGMATPLQYGQTPNAIYPGEAIFVANPNATAEDDGVLLTVVFDTASQLSSLVVLNAQTMTEIGRATAPNLVPLGFHGYFAPDL